MTRQPTNHYIKFLTAAAFVVFFWFVFRLGFHHDVSERFEGFMKAGAPVGYEPAHYTGPAVKGEDGVHPDVLSAEAAESYCYNYRLFPLSREDATKRKIFDLLLINTELEILDIRLGQMAPGVDYFVILESDKTFTDKEKPLFVSDNWARFAPYHAQMIRRTMDLSSPDFQNTWAREKASRNAMYEQVIPTLTDDQAAATDDVLLVSDVDEFFKPETLKVLRNCAVQPKMTVRSRMYYYSFQWQTDNGWGHPQATLYRGQDTILPDDLRRGGDDFYVFPEGGWHCSYCFSTLAEMVKKITSFSHTELDRDEFKDPVKIVNRVRHGHDMLDRNNCTRIERNFDVPDFVKNNVKQYLYLLDRDPPSANFKDWDPVAQKLIEEEATES